MSFTPHIDPPALTHSPRQLVACIPLVVPSIRIREFMGPGIQEVYTVLQAQGIAPAGPWLTHHRRAPTDTFDFRICVPVERPVAASGRVQPGEIPAMRVARTQYRGPYESLHDGWGQFMRWLGDNGHRVKDELWEVYRVGPEAGPDGARYVTELNRPLAE